MGHKKKKNQTPEITSTADKNKKLGIILLFAVILIVIVAVYVLFMQPPTGDPDNGIVTPKGNPIAVFETNLGTFKVELFEDKTPITATNFMKLVNDGFYDGMLFYRISQGFMIQAGRYYPDGSQEISSYGNIEFEGREDLLHIDGAISMASTGARVGGSAEFFICDGAQPGLDGNYAVFGVVIEGIDIVRNIASQPHDSAHPAGGGKPLTDIIINSITIET